MSEFPLVSYLALEFFIKFVGWFGLLDEISDEFDGLNDGMHQMLVHFKACVHAWSESFSVSTTENPLSPLSHGCPDRECSPHRITFVFVWVFSKFSCFIALMLILTFHSASYQLSGGICGPVGSIESIRVRIGLGGTVVVGTALYLITSAASEFAFFCKF